MSFASVYAPDPGTLAALVHPMRTAGETKGDVAEVAAASGESIRTWCRTGWQKVAQGDRHDLERYRRNLELGRAAASDPLSGLSAETTATLLAACTALDARFASECQGSDAPEGMTPQMDSLTRMRREASVVEHALLLSGVPQGTHGTDIFRRYAHTRIDAGEQAAHLEAMVDLERDPPMTVAVAGAVVAAMPTPPATGLPKTMASFWTSVGNAPLLAWSKAGKWARATGDTLGSAPPAFRKAEAAFVASKPAYTAAREPEPTLTARQTAALGKSLAQAQTQVEQFTEIAYPYVQRRAQGESGPISAILTGTAQARSQATSLTDRVKSAGALVRNSQQNGATWAHLSPVDRAMVRIDLMLESGHGPAEALGLAIAREPSLRASDAATLRAFATTHADTVANALVESLEGERPDGWTDVSPLGPGERPTDGLVTQAEVLLRDTPLPTKLPTPASLPGDVQFARSILLRAEADAMRRNVDATTGPYTALRTEGIVPAASDARGMAWGNAVSPTSLLSLNAMLLLDAAAPAPRTPVAAGLPIIARHGRRP